MSVWVRAAAAAAAAELPLLLAFIYLFLGEWGPFLGISLAQPIFHLKDPGHIKKKNPIFFFWRLAPLTVGSYHHV